MAKEKKIIIWDANEINYLLRIYNKPILVFEELNRPNENLGNF